MGTRLFALVLTVAGMLSAACSNVANTTLSPPALPHPSSLVRPHSRLFVANAGNNTITVYDESGNELKTGGGFPNVHGPQAIAYDSADQLLYVTMNDGHTTSVSVYDTDGNQRLSCGFSIIGGFGIAFDPSNRHLYVIDFGPLPGSGAVHVYDQRGHLVSTSGTFAIDLNPTAIAFDPLNRELYVTIINGTGPPFSGDINLFDENGNKITPTGNSHGVTLSNPVGIAFDPIHRLFYIANNGLFSQIAVFDQDLNGIRNFPFVSFPKAIAFDSSDGLVYTANNDNSMTVYNQSGKPVTTSGTFPNLSTPAALVAVP
jgi:YD repeat-containing protein